ncbi:MAG: hypothetical protein ACLUPL_02930 [Butyricimonas virosa]
MREIGFFYTGGTGTIGHLKKRVLCLFLVTNRVDSLFLRLQAKEFGKEDVETETFRVLRSRMLAYRRDSLNEEWVLRLLKSVYHVN